MKTHNEKARIFSALHQKGNPLILFNIWDAGSAKAVMSGGAKALATGSWSVAAANNFSDGENVPLDFVAENLARITQAVDSPVTLDFEGGYTEDAAALNTNAARIIKAGAVGINFEDQIVGTQNIREIQQQAARITAIRQAAAELDAEFFINARTDVFLKSAPDEHKHKMDEVIARAESYAKAGADGFFAPGLRDQNLIKKLCDASPIPVNIMIMGDSPASNILAELGVARISYGPIPFIQLIEELRRKAEQIFNPQ